MEIIIRGETNEIAAFVLAVQERQEEDKCVKFAKELHQEFKARREDIRAGREP